VLRVYDIIAETPLPPDGTDPAPPTCKGRERGDPQRYEMYLRKALDLIEIKLPLATIFLLGKEPD